MERLTKQNQYLEEQLQQKNAVMGTQEKVQEDTSAEQRDQEGPKGSNASSRPEWQDLSRPSVIDDEGTNGLDDEHPQRASI